MVDVLETMVGSVSRSVYSQSRGQGCTLFAQADGRRRTDVVRIRMAFCTGWLAAAAKGLKSGDFVEMARFLLSHLRPMH